MISLWWEILKNAKISGKATGQGKSLDASKIKINIDKEDCNKKLKELQRFLKSYGTKIESVLKRTIEKINKDNPPTNKETREDNISGTAPLRFHKEVGEHYKGMVEYRIATRINRSTLRILVYYEYKPIPEEMACKLIDLYNSPESDDLNMNSDYENDPHLHAHRKKGNSRLKYDAPRVFLSAGAYFPAILKLGVEMSNGYFSNYDNQDEHLKEIYDAIRLLDASNKIEAILR